jgi:hypothetical protein
VHRGADAVPGNVDEVDQHVAVVEATVAERVAAQLRRGLEVPVRADRARDDRGGQQRGDVVPRLRQVPRQFLGLLDFAAAAALVLEEAAADLQPAPFVQHDRTLQALAVEVRAVAGAEVLGDHVAVGDVDLQVESRDPRVRDHDVARLVATDRERLGAERMARDDVLAVEHD